MIYRLSVRRFLSFASVYILFLLLFLCTDEAVAGVKRGAALTVNVLFPSLFPFLVLSELLVAVGADELMGKLLGKPLRRLFGITDGGTCALLLGMLCGFPTGMSTAVTLKKRGVITDKELRRLFLFANNPSPGFLIGVVGNTMLGSATAGAILFVAVTLSAATVGILLRLFCGAVTPVSPDIPRRTHHETDVAGCVRRGFFAMLQVAAPVLFFSAVTACLCRMLRGLSLSPIAELLPMGILEMTAGMHGAVTTLSPPTALLLCAFFAGFSGISVCMQLLSVAEGERLSLLPYLLMKTLQGIFSLVLIALYLKLFHPTLHTSESVFYLSGIHAPHRCYLPIFGVFLVLLFMLALTQRRRRAN